MVNFPYSKNNWYDPNPFDFNTDMSTKENITPSAATKYIKPNSSRKTSNNQDMSTKENITPSAAIIKSEQGFSQKPSPSEDFQQRAESIARQQAHLKGRTTLKGARDRIDQYKMVKSSSISTPFIVTGEHGSQSMAKSKVLEIMEEKPKIEKKRLKPISEKATFVYNEMSWVERLSANFRVSTFHPRGFEYTASVFGIGLRTPHEITKEVMTTELRKKDRGLLSSFIGGSVDVMSSPPIVAATTFGGGYGISKGLASLTGKSLYLSKGTLLGMGALTIGYEAQEGIYEYKQGESAKAVGRGLGLGLGISSFTFGSRMARQEILASRLGKQMTENMGLIKQVETPKFGYTQKVKFSPKKGKLGIVDIERSNMYLKGKYSKIPKAKTEGFKHEQISIAAELQPTRTKWKTQFSHFLSGVEEGMLNKKGTARLTPQITQKYITTPRGYTIQIPKTIIGLTPIAKSSTIFKSTTRQKSSTDVRKALNIDTLFKQVESYASKEKVKIDNRQDFKTIPSTFIGTGMYTSTRVDYDFRKVPKEIQPSTNSLHIPYSTPKPPRFDFPPTGGGIGFGGSWFGGLNHSLKSSLFESRKGIKKYTASVIGLHIGETTSIIPKISSGFGIRLPTKKNRQRWRLF